MCRAVGFLLVGLDVVWVVSVITQRIGRATYLDTSVRAVFYIVPSAECFCELGMVVVKRFRMLLGTRRLNVLNASTT